MEFLLAHKVEILSALLAVSEVLALIPQIKASSVTELVISGLKSLLGLLKKDQP